MIEFVDLESGFVIMDFHAYKEFSYIKQLCVEKWKPIAYAGDYSALKEIQARAWVKKVSSGYMDYQYSLQDYLHDGTIKLRPKGKPTAKEVMATAIKVLEEETGNAVVYILVVRK